jgi:hypothetical protein
MLRTLLATLTCTLFATTSSAGELYCTGAITQVAFHSGAGNGFMLQLSTMNVPVFFCDPSATWSVPGTGYNTPPDQCKALISAFLAGKLAGRTLSALIFDGAAVPTTCDAWPSWTKANIRYFSWAD